MTGECNKCNNEALWSYTPDCWWHSGMRITALIFFINALALTWLLLFALVPRETLAWFIDGAFYALALCLGVAKWPGN
jgi:hypothetical protein